MLSLTDDGPDPEDQECFEDEELDSVQFNNVTAVDDVNKTC